MNHFARIVLFAAGLGFFGFGLWFLIDPIAPLHMAGVQTDGDIARIEFRAFYGGLEVALGGLLWYCAVKPDWQRFGLSLVLIAHIGLALGRLLGLALNPVFTSFIITALIWEIGFALLAALALRKKP